MFWLALLLVFLLIIIVVIAVIMKGGTLKNTKFKISLTKHLFFEYDNRDFKNRKHR